MSKFGQKPVRKKSLHLWISRRMHRLNGSDLFLAFAKISLFFLSFSSGAQRLVLAYTIYTKPQRSVVLLFFWLFLDRKRSQRTARLVVACKTCAIKRLCKIKSYTLKEAIILRPNRVGTQQLDFCGSFDI